MRKREERKKEGVNYNIHQGACRGNSSQGRGEAMREVLSQTARQREGSVTTASRGRGRGARVDKEDTT